MPNAHRKIDFARPEHTKIFRIPILSLSRGFSAVAELLVRHTLVSSKITNKYIGLFFFPKNTIKIKQNMRKVIIANMKLII